LRNKRGEDKQAHGDGSFGGQQPGQQPGWQQQPGQQPWNQQPGFGRPGGGNMIEDWNRREREQTRPGYDFGRPEGGPYRDWERPRSIPKPQPYRPPIDFDDPKYKDIFKDRQPQQPFKDPRMPERYIPDWAKPQQPFKDPRMPHKFIPPEFQDQRPLNPRDFEMGNQHPQAQNAWYKQPRPGTPPPRAINLGADKQAGLLDFIKGRYAESTGGVPWAVPAAVGAGAGGLYGGWKLMDYLLDKRRKDNLDEDLEEAKEEYESALSDVSKEAADGSLSADLNQLYDDLNLYGEKAAASWPEWGGRAAGAYGTAAGFGALLMALIGYKHGKKKQRRRVLERAQARKRREEYSRRPDPLFARSNRSLDMAPTVADGSSDAAPSLDEIEDQLL
jgi:hypothetical protein